MYLHVIFKLQFKDNLTVWYRNVFVCVFQEHRNLSQLPNFLFSTALCYFHLSQQEDMDAEEREEQRRKADQMLQDALIMFPGGYLINV